MKYNTEEKKLVMPEYGRNIQNMVDYCITIQDREERKRCADTIINIMGNMFPHLRDVNDFKHILWDHLAIMADFKLDIDPESNRIRTGYGKGPVDQIAGYPNEEIVPYLEQGVRRRPENF